MKILPRTRQNKLVAISMLVVATPLYAQDQSHNLNIGPQSVAGALKTLANQTHMQIVSDGSALQGRQTQGVKGLYTNRAAIQKLLADTGLVYTFTADNAVAVKPAPKQPNKAEPTTLAPMTVVGERGYDATDPFNPDYVQPDATTGTKTDTPIMETPLNVQVITKQVLRDQQVIRLDQALSNVSGVTMTNAAGNGDEIFLRGFATTTLFRNGFRLDAFSTFSSIGQQLANVESIEVLKGPAAILYGRVEPGGMVNVITKQPLATPYYSLNQQFGSYDLYRTSIDATGPLTKDDTLLYRFNGSFQSNNSFRDLVTGENVFLAPIIKWNISPRTQATLEMEYQYDKSSSDSQFLPFDKANNRFIDLPHKQNLGEGNPANAETIFVGFNWSHQFNDDWSIKHQVNLKRLDFNQGTAATPQFIDLAENTVERSLFSSQVTNDTGATILDLTGHFKTWGLGHTLLFGGDYYRFNSKRSSLYSDFDTPSIINLYNPVHPGTDGAINPLTYLVNSYTDNYGLYLQDQIKLPYNVHIMGGLRYQYIHSKNTTEDLFFETSTNTVQTNDAVTPRVGLLWQPQNWLSLYSNYTENFGANVGALLFAGYDPAGIPLPGEPVGPTSAQQWEVGVKSEFFDGRLRATLAYYDLTKQNVATANPDPLLAGLGFSVVAGEVRSRGPELDIKGEILPGWNVIATYANQDVRVTKSNDTEESGSAFLVGNRLAFVPRNIGSFWSTYEVQQGPLDGFKIGGGVKLQDGVVNLNNKTNSTGYVLVGMMTGYSFEVGKSRITAQLNIDNLLDKTYFTNANAIPDSGFGTVVFSTPRTFMGSINIQY